MENQKELTDKLYEYKDKLEGKDNAMEIEENQEKKE